MGISESIESGFLCCDKEILKKRSYITPLLRAVWDGVFPS